MTRKRTLLSWSSGKDSAWALHTLSQQQEFEIVGLLTTFNDAFDRVAMHGTRRELVLAQAQSIGLPMFEVFLPWPCSNDIYEKSFGEKLSDLVSVLSITHIAFGDLFLNDIRAYRERQISSLKLNLEPVFPIWGLSTSELAETMIDSGVKAVTTCIDSKSLPERFVGRDFDHSFLSELPDNVDPCGENGEFHTFVSAGPMFNEPLSISKGEVVTRDGFIFCDLQMSEESPN